MRVRFKNTLSAKTVKILQKDARDAPQENQEVELVVVTVAAVAELAGAAVAPMPLSSQREIAQLEKKEPTTMAMTLKATAKQLMAKTREKEFVSLEQQEKEKKKSKTIEKMVKSENTLEVMEKEHQEEDAHRQAPIDQLKSTTLMTPIEEVVADEVAVEAEAEAEKKEQKDTAAIDKTTTEVEKIDPVAVEAEVVMEKKEQKDEEDTEVEAMVKHVNPVLKTVVDVADVVEDLPSMARHHVRTVDSVEEAVTVKTPVVATEMKSPEAEAVKAEAAVAVAARVVAEAVPLTEKETSEVLSLVV